MVKLIGYIVPAILIFSFYCQDKYKNKFKKLWELQVFTYLRYYKSHLKDKVHAKKEQNLMLQEDML